MTATAVPRQRSVGASATEAQRLLAVGERLSRVWRYVVLQLLDDHDTALRHHGLDAARGIWTAEPPVTDEPRVDAALAALAEHLARRDGYPTPPWALDTFREAQEWWFVTDLVGLHPRALVESPLSFRKRGVFITAEALVRV